MCALRMWWPSSIVLSALSGASIRLILKARFACPCLQREYKMLGQEMPSTFGLDVVSSEIARISPCPLSFVARLRLRTLLAWPDRYSHFKACHQCNNNRITCTCSEAHTSDDQRTILYALLACSTGGRQCLRILKGFTEMCACVPSTWKSSTGQILCHWHLQY